MAGGIGITVLVTRDDATPAQQRIFDAVNRKDIQLVMGRGVRNLLIDHFTALEGSLSGRSDLERAGGVPRHFYAQAAKSVQQPVLVPGVVRVSVNQVGMRQRLLGGDIVPLKAGGFLTVPVAPEAYGVRAGRFQNLRIIRIGRGTSQRLVLAAKGGAGALLGRTITLRKKGAKTVLDHLTILYLLLKRVRQRSDPTVLPTNSELTDAAVNAGGAYLESKWGAAGGPN